jgi:hypothetical protein
MCPSSQRMYAIRSPVGESAGEQRKPSSLVRAVGFSPSRSTAQSRRRSPYRILVPSTDHAGPSAIQGTGKRTRLEPSASAMTKSPPERYAIRVPSGDHAGCMARSEPSVIGCTAPVATSTTQILRSSRPSVRVNAIRRPSGDQCGCIVPPISVTRSRTRPSSLIRYRSAPEIVASGEPTYTMGVAGVRDPNGESQPAVAAQNATRTVNGRMARMGGEVQDGSDGRAAWPRL